MREFPKLIGVIHLLPLGGAPGADADLPEVSLQKAGLRAVEEAKALAKAGYQGIILENFGDAPFFKDSVPPETLVSMGIISAAVREAVSIPVGVNVLRNDARSALGIAAVTGSSFIRVNVLSGVVATDQGLIEGQAAELIRERNRIAPHVKILADVHVKHGVTLSSMYLDLAVEETFERASADAVILTGPTTGRSVGVEQIASAVELSRNRKIPLYLGSGMNPDNVIEMKRFISGVIVGSYIRKNGVAGAALDLKRSREFAKAFLSKVKLKKKQAKTRTKKKRKRMKIQALDQDD